MREARDALELMLAVAQVALSLGDGAPDELESRADDGRRSLSGGELEDLEKGGPAGADRFGARLHHIPQAVEDQVLDLGRLAHAHEVVEGLEELALELVVEQLSLFEKLGGELPEGVERVHGDREVGVLPHLGEKVAEHLPDARPYEAHARHVVVGHLDNLLERVHLRVARRGELVAAHVAEVGDEIDDGVGVEQLRRREDPIDGHHVHLLHEVVRVGRVDGDHVTAARAPARPRRLKDDRVGARRRGARAVGGAAGGGGAQQLGARGAPIGECASGGGRRRGEEDLGVCLCAGANHVEPLELGEALEDLGPAGAEGVAPGESQVDQRLEALNVPPPHGLGGLEVGVLCEHRDERVAFGGHSELGGHVDGVGEAAEGEADDGRRDLVGVLHDARARGEQSAPRGLEHGARVLRVAARVVDRLLARLGLEELLRLLDHVGALHVEELRLGGARGGGRRRGRRPARHHRLVLDLDLVGGDILVEGFEELGGQVARVVDASVHVDELLLGHLLLHLRRVRVRVEHDEREGEHVGRVRVGKDARVERAEALGELLHHPINLLRLARQPEAREEVAQRVVEAHPAKVERVHVNVEHLLVEVVALAEIIADRALVEALRLEQKLADGGGGLLESAHLDQVADAALRLHVELDDALLHLVLPVEHGLKVDRLASAAALRCEHERRARVARRVVGSAAGAPLALRRARWLPLGGRRGHRALGCHRFAAAAARLVAALTFPEHHRVGDADEGLEGERLERRVLVARLGEALARERHPREHVAHGGEDAAPLEVAVVVEEEVDDELRLADEHAERLDGEELLLAGRVGGLEDAQQNVREEDPNLRLEMVLEVPDERHKDVERELQDGRVGRDAILEEREAEVLADGPDELLARAELVARVLHDRVEHLQREELRAQLDGLLGGGRLGQRLHRELAERAEDEEGVALDDGLREALDALEDHVQHLHQRRFRGALDGGALTDEENVKAALHREKERRVVDDRDGGGDGGEHSLDNLTLHALLLLVLAAADRLHDHVHHALLDGTHLDNLAAHVAVGDQLLDAVERDLDNLIVLGLAREAQRHKVPVRAVRGGQHLRPTRRREAHARDALVELRVAPLDHRLLWRHEAGLGGGGDALGNLGFLGRRPRAHGTPNLILVHSHGVSEVVGRRLLVCVYHLTFVGELWVREGCGAILLELICKRRGGQQPRPVSTHPQRTRRTEKPRQSTGGGERAHACTLAAQAQRPPDR